ncbi:MAG TPA: aldolase, partial [Acidimicrobiales bacterium]|nr:aldolase [Acidimicrobiales bacterium]
CRVAMELGADILKVAYPGDPGTLEQWCAELRLPIVMLGGPRGGTTEELLSMVAEAVKAGASGIVIGRRVWQRPTDEAAAILEQLYAIVHARG